MCVTDCNKIISVIDGLAPDQKTASHRAQEISTQEINLTRQRLICHTELQASCHLPTS